MLVVYLKPRKPSTDPRARSLLQKAVRRGFPSVTKLVIRYLNEIGDSKWLQSRAVVITYEECWPLGINLFSNREFKDRSGILFDVCRREKQKDSAGLGALAYAYSQGDTSMLDCVPDKHLLKIVAEALRRPTDYFNWASAGLKSKSRINLVHAAQQHLPSATWPWDKACILASAVLASDNEIPSPADVECETGIEFPFWVALDKHTDEGKIAIRAVSKILKVPYRQVLWSSFYCESVQVNRLLPSPWFEAEKIWRLRKADLTPENADDLWLMAAPLMNHYLTEHALKLRDNIGLDANAHSPPIQSSLF